MICRLETVRVPGAWTFISNHASLIAKAEREVGGLTVASATLAQQGLFMCPCFKGQFKTHAIPVFKGSEKA